LRNLPTYVKAGDIIGFSGFYWRSALVNLGSVGIPFWSLSHVGVMAHAPDYMHGKLLLFESNEDSRKCEITGKVGTGVQAHDLQEVVEQYRGRVWYYPLYRPLYWHESTRLTDFLLSAIDRPYDQAGAVRSGGIALSFFESLFREQDLSALFCSETVASAHANIGTFRTTNASRWNPNSLMRKLRRIELVGTPRKMK